MIYLDNSATSFPKPSEVYESTFRFMKESGGNPGRGAHFYSSASSQVLNTTRREVAQFFGVENSRRVIFTFGCTDSINIVLKGFLKSGDHVIASNLDHNSISRPLNHLAKKLPLELTRLPFDSRGRLDPEGVRKALQKNTRLIVLTHGSNVLGSVQPLQTFGEIAREANAFLLLDAAQSAGRIPIHLGSLPVFLVCSGHKALFGMPGVGILTVPEGAHLEKWREGGTGTDSENLDHPEELPMLLEAGTPNFLGIASLQSGISFLTKTGVGTLHAAESRLVRPLRSFLADDSRFVLYSPDEGDALPVVSFNLGKAPAEELAAILDQEFKIAVRAGLHCAAVTHAQLKTSPRGCVRISPGYFNTREEIDSLLAALQRIADVY